MGMEKEYTCPICNTAFKRHTYWVKIDTPFCSKKCRYESQKTSFLGENNPNFDNRWSQERKDAHSEFLKTIIDDEYRWKAGSANRGKKFSQDRIDRMHGNRTSESYSRPCTDEARKIIGEKSKAKFTPEYKVRQRKINEELGIWIPLDQMDDYIFYRNISNWIEKMFDRVTIGIEKLYEFGVLNTHTNTNGVVRDHIYSRKSGFQNGVFPELLRHPCNCQILTNSENVSKKKKRYVDADAISLNTLFENIQHYVGDWKEHALCLELITKYINGERYQKQTYIDAIYNPLIEPK